MRLTTAFRRALSLASEILLEILTPRSSGTKTRKRPGKLIAVETRGPL
ncbi:MAG: hypothetical protein BWY75_02907 [bacterium ADurb.Bin425]|nr:MAG: hypothetical protein BWY75_02907 [bacterium ADurb.Bin425]